MAKIQAKRSRTKLSLLKEKIFRGKIGSKTESNKSKKNAYTSIPESPPRRMPNVISITQGSPTSVFSGVSGTTGMPEMRPQGRSMMTSILPTLTTDGESLSEQGESFFASDSGSTTFSHRLKASRSLSQCSPPEFPSFLMKNSMRATKAKELERKSFLYGSKRFRKLSDWAFDVVDLDKNGQLEKDEVYAGLILVHLKLAAYIGPAACRPADQKYVFEVFDQIDFDGSGYLDREEFVSLMMILCSSIVTRVMLQWSMTIVIVPLVAQYIIEAFEQLHKWFKFVCEEIDEMETISENIALLLHRFGLKVISLLPVQVRLCAQTASKLIDQVVPDETIKTLPVTILGAILGALLIPFLLEKCDKFYRGLAWKKSRSKKKTC